MFEVGAERKEGASRSCRWRKKKGKWKKKKQIRKEVNGVNHQTKPKGVTIYLAGETLKNKSLRAK
jgi:hypothetical protein